MGFLANTKKKSNIHDVSFLRPKMNLRLSSEAIFSFNSVTLLFQIGQTAVCITIEETSAKTTFCQRNESLQVNIYKRRTYQWLLI